MIRKINIKILSLTLLSLLTLTIIGLWLWLENLESQISQRLEKGWFKAPIEFYSSPYMISSGRILSTKELNEQFLLRGYRNTKSDRILPQEFKWWSLDTCQNNLSEALNEETTQCLAFRDANRSTLGVVAVSSTTKVLQIFKGEPLLVTQSLELPPYMFAQYYGKSPILRQVLSLPDIPLYCSQAVTAIEDKKFLQHKGFSPIGFARAAIRNIVSGYYAQGGSTITQQLVKNYFLTSEKTIKRKLNEIVMALVLETKFEKEQILENYLNVIYMGQNGPFEIRGFGAASRHYLNKDIAQLNLPECALLAAILNNPGRYNPFRHPEKAKLRREKVLKHMLELQMIDQQQHDTSNISLMPKAEQRIKISPAPYYVDAVYKNLKQMNFLPAYEEKGLKVFTYLNLNAQKQAQVAVSETIDSLEANLKTPKKLKADGHHLQGLLIHIDLQTGGVVSLIGGKSFGVSQYNRAVESSRQVGSVFKPLVYLSALESQDSNGDYYNPLSIISDSPFTHKYEGQKWSPKNYSNKFHGEIPMFYALKNSINVATARLGIDIGLDHIIDVSRRMGVESNLSPLPSLTLGAFEMKPLEVAKVYAGIARMGSVPELHIVKKIETLNGETIYEAKQRAEQRVAQENVAQLVSMMKQTFNSGTAKSAKRYGFNHIAAGKTGTTSDTKDTWFAGFTPFDLTLVWVGYDQNEVSGLTGASGALPVWINYMKKITAEYESTDFTWPESLSTKTITPEHLESLIEEVKDDEKTDFELLIRE